MGMDIEGRSGNTFRANTWSWCPICYFMEVAGFEVPTDWHTNTGAGLDRRNAMISQIVWRSC